jgi:uncharacterized protein
MKFEFNEKKSLSNKEKHGIDFFEAQKLWLDEERIIIPGISIDEERFILIGIIGIKHWSLIYTERKTKIRIISVRRSRREEVVLYES